MTYRFKYGKDFEVEAFQYNGDMICSDGQPYVPQWAIDALKSGVLYYKDAGELYLAFYTHTEDEDRQGLYIEVGDYIVKLCNGEIGVRTEKYFLKHFEQIEDKGDRK